MMKTYARIDRGIFMERIDPKPYDSEAWDWFEGDPSRIGTEEPIEDRYTAELVATMVEITGLNPLPLPGWTYANGIFAPPVPYMPTPAETLERNTRMRDGLMTQAGLAIAPLQDAIDLGDATSAETLLLTKWKQYRIAVNRVNLTLIDPAWPSHPTVA
jgi:hypothetical protein